MDNIINTISIETLKAVRCGVIDICGENNTLDVKNAIPNDYQNLTVNNFYISLGVGFQTWVGGSSRTNKYCTFTYNSSTGILTSGQMASATMIDDAVVYAIY